MQKFKNSNTTSLSNFQTMCATLVSSFFVSSKTFEKMKRKEFFWGLKKSYESQYVCGSLERLERMKDAELPFI